MTHVVRVELENFFRFSGEHAIDLGPGVHAVGARDEGDQKRSNWIGKSTFLSALPFALYGWHNAPSEAGWVTRGARSGRARVVLSDGTSVERSRVKTTQLVVKTADGRELGGDGAEQHVRALVGMSEQDFFAACFVRQKQMSRLITATPSERARVVGGWVDLDGLERGVKACAVRLSRAIEKKRSLAADRDRVSAGLAFVATQVQGTDQATPAQVLATLDQLIAALEEEQASIEESAASAAADAAEERKREEAAEFAELDAAGKRKRAELDALGSAVALEEAQRVAADALKVKQEALGAATSSHDSAQKAASGEFDGKCPVAGIACPARDIISVSVLETRAHCAAAKKALDEARVAAADAAVAKHAADAAVAERVRGDAALAAMRERARRLKPSADWARANPAKDEELEVRRPLAEVVEELARARIDRQNFTRDAERLEQLEHEIADADLALEVEGSALRTFRQARITVMTGSMARIERGANAMLAEAGVDLSVAVSWGREGKDPATHCDCGNPFSRSAREKACTRCGAERGKNVVERLDIVPSDVSGAAEDLAGVAFQLSAAAWMLRRRGSSWGVLCVDEPFGALDESNRDALARQLSSMVRRGFSQAFIVTHDRGVSDALPLRVDLVGRGSRDEGRTWFA